MTDIRFRGKRPLAIAVRNAELPPFKNGEHNSENASTIDHVIAPLRRWLNDSLEQKEKTKCSVVLMDSARTVGLKVTF